jgi:hypothetical protein|tara:strand:+ start:398 stop:604 length:207 start_codon:yes stop_codon:yes gene_type:complete
LKISSELEPVKNLRTIAKSAHYEFWDKDKILILDIKKAMHDYYRTSLNQYTKKRRSAVLTFANYSVID